MSENGSAPDVAEVLNGAAVLEGSEEGGGPQDPDDLDGPDGLENEDGLEGEEEQEWPEDLVRVAALAPDHLIRIVDSAWSGDGEPPEWAVGGAWLTDSDGKIAEGEINENYRPSPKTLGWPDPVDAVDEAVQLAATGYLSEDAVARELAVAQVMVFLGPDGVPAVVRAPDGTDVVTVSSANVNVDEESHPHERMPVAELLERTEERYDVYYLSPSAPVSVVVEAETLLSTLSGTLASGRDEVETAEGAEGRVGIPATQSAGQAWDTGEASPNGSQPRRVRPVDDIALPDEPPAESSEGLPEEK